MKPLKLRKLGNSVGLILPRKILDTLNVKSGDFIDAAITAQGKVILENHLPHHSKWKFEKPIKTNKQDSQWLDADFEEGLEDENSNW